MSEEQLVNFCLFFFYSSEYGTSISIKWAQTPQCNSTAFRRVSFSFQIRLFYLCAVIYKASRTVVCNRSPQVLTWKLLFKFSFKGPASLRVLWNEVLTYLSYRKLYISDTGRTVFLSSADLKQCSSKAFEVVTANHIRWRFGSGFLNFSGSFISPWKQRPIVAVVSSLPWPKD